MELILAATGRTSPAAIPISFDAGSLGGFCLRVRDGGRVVQVWAMGELVADLRVGDERDEIDVHLDRIADAELELFGRAVGRALEVAADAERREPLAAAVGVRTLPVQGTVHRLVLRQRRSELLPAGPGAVGDALRAPGRSNPSARPIWSLTAIRAVRRSLDGIRIAVMAVAIAAVAVAHLAPIVGSQPVVIRGGSMEPSIPSGSLVLLDARDPAEVAVGDVVTRRTASGTLVTHRVVRVTQIDGVPHFETRGDASNSTDPVLAAPEEVEGVVALHVPFAGYLVAFLGQPSGILSVLGVLLMLLLAANLLDEIERDRGAGASVVRADRRAARGGSAVATAVPA